MVRKRYVPDHILVASGIALCIVGCFNVTKYSTAGDNVGVFMKHDGRGLIYTM